MGKENKRSPETGDITKKEFTSFAKGILHAGNEYPALITVFLISEIAQGLWILGEAWNGTPLASDEIEARMRLTTLFGIFGGLSTEGLVRAGKNLRKRIRH